MILLSALVVAVVALWVLGPLLGWGATEAFPAEATAKNELLARRQEALKDLKDLEMEFAVGKLTREDFERTKAELSHQAVEIYKEIDAQAPVHDAR
jgi:hypothetical protein